MGIFSLEKNVSSDNRTMRFSTPLIKGTLVKKYRRFIVDVKLDDGSVVTAHCPTMGPMNGVSEPGHAVLLSDSGLETRRNRLTWELINVDGTWVGVNSAIPQKVLVEAVQEQRIPSLKGFGEIQADVTYGLGNKIDVMLLGMEHNCFIDTFSVSWVEKDTALFPDSPSPRMTKSIRQLKEIAEQGHRAVGFFLVQRGDCSVFKPARQVDKEFHNAMIAAQQAGVEIMVYQAHITPEGITLGTPLPFSLT
jgi:sugar fermentation stimulation protein A